MNLGSFFLKVNYIMKNIFSKVKFHKHVEMKKSTHIKGKLNLGDKSTVQLTSITSNVAVDTNSGLITTFNNTFVSGNTYTFTVIDSHVKNSSVILLTGNYINGCYYDLYVSNVIDGQFNINIYVYSAIGGGVTSAMNINFLVC